MIRTPSVPRDGWQARIRDSGLVYWETMLPDGGTLSYWNEDHHYELTIDETIDLEIATNELVEMCIEAGDQIIALDLFDKLGIPDFAKERIIETWEAEPPMVYGRFDLAYSGDGPPKLLEFNADTPTSLVETAVTQWEWMQDYDATADQWNSLHERLIARWKELADRLPGGELHCLHTTGEPSGEDFMTTVYMADVASQAGLEAYTQPIEQLGWVEGVGFVDAEDRSVRNAFKLYPWEWMLGEEFGRRSLAFMGDGPDHTQWIEPIWKMLWSNKGLLAVLWDLYPGHRNLVPAFFADDPRGHELKSYVRKPLLAREGANTEIVIDGEVVEHGPDQGYGEEGYVVQQYVDLGTFDGQHPVIGSWVVDQESAGCGIRESASLVTNNLSRFVPHMIDG